ncbi:MAG: nucleotidyltransferase domain-containing protein [Candidatus Omnitrophota bacterium]
MNKNTILKKLEDVRAGVREKYKADIKGIFGSYAIGKEKRGSDIDILVDFYNEADFLDLVGLALFLEKKLNHKVDVVPKGSIRKELKTAILKQAIYL